MISQTKGITHAYVTSCIDQNNSLLIDLPKKSLKHCQHVQNASAKLIVRAKKRDHVTSIFIYFQGALLNRGSCLWFSYLTLSHYMGREPPT